MFSRMSRATAIGFMTVAVAVLLMSCSNDDPTAPNSKTNDVITQVAAGGPPPDPGPPAEGIVVEGVSVPGIALSFTRSQVEDAYGDDPTWCQSDGAPGNKAFCSWAVNSGGQVDVHFQGPDGGVASGSPDDVVFKISWSEAVSGWETTAGVTTTLAKENPEAVIAAYPDAQVTYNQWGGISSVKDHPLGIEVIWVPDFYSGTTHIRMAVFYPREAPPLPEQLTYVYTIDLTAKKVRGQRQIRGFVGVREETQLAAKGATVFASWTFPDGSTQAAESTTSQSGFAYFEINGIPRGTYILTVEDVVLEGHRFDSENSVLSASVEVK
jgi:hypothetical protein